MGKDRSYTLYEHLVFFWSKKWFFLFIPTITVILALAFTFIPKPYEATSDIYVGGVKGQSLTRPKIIQASYEDHLTPALRRSFSVTVPQNNIVSFKLTGDASIIEEELNELVSQYVDELLLRYEEQYNGRVEQKRILEEKIKYLEPDIIKNREQLNNVNLQLREKTAILELLAVDEGSLRVYLEHLQFIDEELSLLEEPRVLDVSVTKETYRLPITIVSVALGLFLTIVVLTFWKYINEARENN